MKSNDHDLRARALLSYIDETDVSEAARHESRNREKHLPPLSTFRWWARRTGAVNSAVLEAAREVFGDTRLTVLDPFAGGGTIPLVALRAGHRVYAQDLNPWAVAGIRQMLTLPDPTDLDSAFRRLAELADPLLQAAYTSENETILHTYRVVVGRCGSCGREHRQFPYSLLTLRYRKERRRPEAVFACAAGHVFYGCRDEPLRCPNCSRRVDPTEIYLPRRIVTCPGCGGQEKLADRAARPGWRWEVCLLEKGGPSGRRFAIPTAQDVRQADEGWEKSANLGVIPIGAETSVLRRHGFVTWSDLYPARQYAVTSKLLELALKASDDTSVVDALRMAIVGTTEFAGHLSRWDRFYLKCNDATAGHRFNFSTFVPELNVWGSDLLGRGTVARRINSMTKAARWFEANIGRPAIAPIGSTDTQPPEVADAQIVCGDSARLLSVETGSVDLVLTDPPYHDDVHYGELSLPFRTWAGLPVENLEGEAATNPSTGINTSFDAYCQSLVRIFSECRRVLKPRGRLVFSYANHEPSAWVALFAALQQAGFFAVSCVSVHSENETDFKKRDVQSCTEDLLIELAPSSTSTQGRVFGSISRHRFMGPVASLFVQVGRLKPGWQSEALKVLTSAKKL